MNIVIQEIEFFLSEDSKKLNKEKFDDLLYTEICKLYENHITELGVVQKNSIKIFKETKNIKYEKKGIQVSIFIQCNSFLPNIGDSVNVEIIQKDQNCFYRI